MVLIIIIRFLHEEPRRDLDNDSVLLRCSVTVVAVQFAHRRQIIIIIITLLL